MTFLRPLVAMLMVFVPVSASAAAAPLDGSPYTGVNLLGFLFDAPPATPGELSQAAAVTQTTSGSATVYQCQGTASEIKTAKNVTFTRQQTMCNNITVKEVGGQADIVFKSICTNPKEGCKASCSGQHGSIQYALSSSGSVKTIDPCKTTLPSGITITPDSPSPISVEALRTLNPANELDQAKMVDMYTNLGMPQDAAQTIVKSDPTNAYRLLDAMATGDQAQATQIAQEFHIDQNIIDSQMGRIDSAGGDYGGGGDTVLDSSNSGSICGYSGVGDRIMLPESGCGEKNGSGTYQGPGQFSCSTWSSYANAVGRSEWSDCANRMNPDKAVPVMNEYYENIMKPKYGSTCESIGATWNSCVLAIHACGEAGFTRMVSTVQNNPDAPTSSMCGGNNQSYMNKYNPAGTAGGTFASLDQFMNCGWSCNSPGVTTPGKYLGSAASVGSPSLSKNYWVNPGYDQINRTSSGWSGSSNYSVRSDNSLFGGNNQSLMTMMMMSQMSNLMKGFGTTGSTFTTTPTNQKPPTPPPASLSITATPTSAKKGESISLNWTSNATLLNPPCQVTQNGTVISQANAGSRTIATNASTTPTLTFLLSCRAANNGQTIQQSAVVNLQ